jgi:RNA polymerase sigma factor (sigma-70 family)
MKKTTPSFTLAIAPAVITRAQQGDLAAHEMFFKHFSKPVYNLALRLCNQKELAEDVLQNTFLNVFDNVDTFQSQAPLGLWLRKIAVNESLMMLRKNRQLANFVSFEDHETFDNALELAANVSQENGDIHQFQVQSSLEAILVQLPSQTRLVLWLKEVEGYSHQEIAELTGKTESFSKSLLSRTFKRLRSCFMTDSQSSEHS